MNKELELWHFIASRQAKGEALMLLVVAESSGSSPGRAGYKMAVSADGELCGSIGGGVMEVNLVEQCRSHLSEPGAIATGFQQAQSIKQEHRKNAKHPSGMICSGAQTVIVKELSFGDLKTVEDLIDCGQNRKTVSIEISDSSFKLIENTKDNYRYYFSQTGDAKFVYQEKLGHKHNLFIIGGGHCALALSDLMSKIDFRISIFDDRPDLNTLEKNRFAHEITIIDSYETIGDFIASGDDNFVVVMTIGYAFDEIVIRNLFDKNFKYFGVLGSKAKMKTLLAALKKDGFSSERLSRIRTPIGLDINSRTPEEIAISIAAEIIAVKNS